MEFLWLWQVSYTKGRLTGLWKIQNSFWKYPTFFSFSASCTVNLRYITGYGKDGGLSLLWLVFVLCNGNSSEYILVNFIWKATSCWMAIIILIYILIILIIRILFFFLGKNASAYKQLNNEKSCFKKWLFNFISSSLKPYFVSVGEGQTGTTPGAGRITKFCILLFYSSSCAQYCQTGNKNYGHFR